MSMNFVNIVKEALAHLSPSEVRAEADRPVSIGLYAESETGYRQMESFFQSVGSSDPLRRAAHYVGAEPFDVEIYSDEMSAGSKGFTFRPEHPESTVKQILHAHPDLSIALARRIGAFREPVANGVIQKIAMENALFALATALPDIVPLLSLPWSVGEFASDTAVLTANQIRMAFLLAAITDRKIGYGEQKGEVASVLLSAFGWRALARELVGRIPFGGGLIPKAAVAYAGTLVAGLSLERYYRVGHAYTRAERKAAYKESLERGKSLVGLLVDREKPR